MHWNLTLPTGYKKLVDGATVDAAFMDSSDTWSNLFGTGNPAALVEMQDSILRFKNPSVGTYSLRLDFEEGWGQVYNYGTDDAKISIYKGLSPDGLVQEWHSTRTENAISWYFGDLIVTGTGNCRTASIAEKDAYSASYNQPAETKSIVPDVFQQCVSTPKCNRVVYGNDAITKTCGEFGDPHVIMFNGTGVTCGLTGTTILVDNDYYTLWTEDDVINTDKTATAIKFLKLRYKVCNPVELWWNHQYPEIEEFAQSPTRGVHNIRLEDNNIYLDAIHTRIQYRSISNTMLVAVSTPQQLAIGGVCSKGCPAGTAIDITDTGATKKDDHMSTNTIDRHEVNSGRAKKQTKVKMNAKQALADCEDAGLTGFELDACTFDLALTGKDAFIQQAQQITEARNNVSESWIAQIGTGNEPSGEGHAILPVIYMLLLVSIAIALL